jgi:hypothetical protein
MKHEAWEPLMRTWTFAEQFRGVVMEDGMAPSGIMVRRTDIAKAVNAVGGMAPPPQTTVKIRKEFPESWIYDDFDFEALGLVVFVQQHFSRVFHFVSCQFAPFLCFSQLSNLIFHQRIKSLRCLTL